MLQCDNYTEILTNINMQNLLVNLEQSLKEIEKKLDQAILIKAREGLKYLNMALNSDSEDIYNQELERAHEVFSHLSCLNEALSTGSVSNSKLICLGSVGNFFYFTLKKNFRNALIEAFECTYNYPEYSVKLFPPELFSQNYCEKLCDIEKKIKDNNQIFIDECLNLPASIKRAIQVLGNGAIVAFGFSAGLLGRNPHLLHAIHKALEDFNKEFNTSIDKSTTKDISTMVKKIKHSYSCLDASKKDKANLISKIKNECLLNKR